MMGNIAMDMFPKAHKQPPVDVQPSFMDKHKQTFADNLYQMYDVTKLWCDLTLVAGIDKTAIQVHRVIICSANEYFHTLLTTPMRPAADNVIVIDGIDGNILRALVGFCYTNEIQINADNVFDIAAAASMFLFRPVEKLCEQFLMKQLNVPNCLGLWLLADRYAYSELQNEVNALFADHFQQLTLQEEFLKLSPDALATFLKLDHLYVWKESQVFEALVTWIDHNEVERVKHVSQILPAIRFKHISDEYIFRMCSAHLQRWNCMDLLEKMNLVTVAARSNLSEPIELDLPIYYPKDSVIIRKFNVFLNKSRTVCRIDGYRYDYGTIRVGDQLYILGGIATRRTTNRPGRGNMNDRHQNEIEEEYGSNTEVTNQVQRVNLLTWDVELMHPMLMRRLRVQSTVLNGFIYVLSDDTDQVERFDLDTLQWSPVASVPRNRSRTQSYITFKCHIYVLLISNDIVRYDAVSNQWSPIASVRRYGPEPEPLEDWEPPYYHLGGTFFIDQNDLMFDATENQTTYCYNSENDEWSVSQRDVNSRRSNLKNTGSVIRFYPE